MRFLFICVIAFIVGCVPVETGEMDVYFCPQDDCKEVFSDFVHNRSVECALYDLEYPELFDADDRVVLDDGNAIGDFKLDTRGQLSHNKFCVWKDWVLTGSTNPTERGFHKNNNNLLIINSPALAQNYREEFKELWSGSYGAGRPVRHSRILFNNHSMENYFCPEDHCKAAVIRALEGAESAVYFMVFSFTDTDIANLLLRRADEGVHVRGVLEKRRINMQYNQFTALNDTIEVLPDANPATLHHKVFIIDNRTVITGSYNPTKSGNERNDENMVIITQPDIVEAYVAEFQKIYNKALD
ncbi:MAG: phospholipase D-like domain-containing protein [Nanobdellota archaeon]